MSSSDRESERAARSREDRAPEHTVLGYVTREHSMNGHPCEEPWAVIRVRHTGNIGFYCGACNVHHHGGPGYDALMEKWGGERDTNPNARGYPPDHLGPVTRGVYLRSDRIYHVPPDKMTSSSRTDNCVSSELQEVDV